MLSSRLEFLKLIDQVWPWPIASITARGLRGAPPIQIMVGRPPARSSPARVRASIIKIHHILGCLARKARPGMSPCPRPPCITVLPLAQSLMGVRRAAERWYNALASRDDRQHASVFFRARTSILTNAMKTQSDCPAAFLPHSSPKRERNYSTAQSSSSSHNPTTVWRRGERGRGRYPNSSGCIVRHCHTRPSCLPRREGGSRAELAPSSAPLTH